MTVKERVLADLYAAGDSYISGEELAERLGVTRAAVWKAIKALQAEGYSISAATNRGYSLSSSSDIISVPAISGNLTTDFPFSIEVRSEVSSTNTVLKEMAAAGAPEGTVLISGMQTAGRGRTGRSFYSPADTGLYISILLRPSLSIEASSAVTTAAAAAAAMAIEDISGKNAEIKWVNDIWMRGKKIAGILTEASVSMENSSLEYAVVGIGINVFYPREGFPGELNEIASSVFEEEEKPADARNRIAARLLDYFARFYRELEAMSYFPEYKKRLFILGRKINVLKNGASIPAVALDIDRDCHLLVRYEDGSEEYLTGGEVSIRPQKGD